MPRETVHRIDPGEYGWKAHYLGLLSEMGCKTPRAVAFSTSEPVTADAVPELGGTRFAVRSSALSEDTYDGSNAGSFLTRLAVARADVPEAALAVRASAHGEPMGVIVQAFVNPVVSGVAFSVEPTTYAYESWAVSWVSGTGDGLVSGRRHGHDVLVDAGTGQLRHGEWFGDVSVLAELQDALQQLAAALATPVDVEWCVARSGGLTLLQVRPVVLPRAAVIELGGPEAFGRLPAIVSNHPKIVLRRRAAEHGVAMTPSRVTIATVRERLEQPPVARSPEIAGSGVVLLHPFTVDRRVVREFAQVGRTDVEFFTSECRRYSIRNYPTFESIIDTEMRVASTGLEGAAVAVVLEQEIWDADVTGIIRGIDNGYLLEVGLGHFVPKGYVETSTYVAGRDRTVTTRREVRQTLAYHFVNGHVLREQDPPGTSWLSDQFVARIIDSLEPLLVVEPGLALEFGVTSRDEAGVIYLIDAAESDDPGVSIETNALEGGVVSRGRAVGLILDLRRGGTAEDLDAHRYQSVVGEGPAEATIFIAERASVDLLPLLYACPPGCGFLFEEASLLAHFAVVLRERGVPGVILSSEDLDRLGGTVVLDTSRTPPVSSAMEGL